MATSPLAAPGATRKDSTVSELEKLLSQAKGLHSRFEPVWYLNLAFYCGEQWLFWNRGRLDRPRLDPWRVTLVDNRIIGIVRTELAKMTKSKPAWQVTPVTTQDDDLQAALTGEKILDFLWQHLTMRDRLVRALLWSRICGAGFWKVFWDSAKGDQVTICVDPEGNPVLDAQTQAPMKPEHFQDGPPEGISPKMIATGDVAIEVRSPFQFHPDPLAENMGELEWCIEEVVKSPEYVQAHFGQAVEPDTVVAPGPVESRMFPSFQLGGTSNYKGVRLMEYWCKPNATHPRGRRAVWTRGKILYEGDNPYSQLPYVMFPALQVPGRFWPTSVVEQLRGPQMELNKVQSQITENAHRIGNPALLASKQANVQYQGVPGERIDFDDTTQNAIPSYLTAPELPGYILQQQDRIQQTLQEISGQHEVTSAQVPAGVTAASAINLLQEADDTRLGPSVYDMEEALGQAGTRLLKLVASYYTDERTIMIAGDDHAWDMMSFRGAALRDNTKVEVQAGSAMPHSKAARQAATQEVLNLALQYSQQPLNPRDLRKVLQDFEAGGLEKLFGDLSPDEQQINRENNQLAQGLSLEINTFDNDQAHLEGHEEWQKGSSYQKLAPEIKAQVEGHVQAHRQRMLSAMAPQLHLPGFNHEGPDGAPGGAGPPAVGQGPPVGANAGPPEGQVQPQNPGFTR